MTLSIILLVQDQALIKKKKKNEIYSPRLKKM